MQLVDNILDDYSVFMALNKKTKFIVKHESQSPIPCPNMNQILTLGLDQV